ncbi:MAG: oligosaccharyl transferase glycoprotein complex, beta subunit [Ramalina farinacea]|uniref:Dolichyl-diphosphooligosaccharide--protein glycosyltransferase subunit WBP1 n=1 Tax=Ramalina farinacea TaxID=258253 RepID=A0AA43QT48_9LECA|nr:oligosaccharyl transferase glycoprotein complex, beta subunit [Ramalina farinacea]
MRWLTPLLLVALAGLGHALSSTGSRLLVVIEEAAEKAKYSRFWADLEDPSTTSFFFRPNPKVTHAEPDVRAAEGLCRAGLGPALTAKNLLQFINQQGNILLTLTSNSPTPSAISSLLLELNIQLPSDRDSTVLDHFNHDTLAASDRHDVLLVPQPSPARSDIRPFFSGDGTIAFPRAVAQILGSESPLTAPILRAQQTAYTYSPNEDSESADEPFAVGEQIALVSALQARNSARFTVFGSAEALEDTWANAKFKDATGRSGRTANQQFAEQVTAWTFQETGVLKVVRAEHYLSQGDRWVPLKTHNVDEIQLEFSMLSPFYRLNLVPMSQTSQSTLYRASFKLPDQHGIFRFEVNYKRPFLTNLDVKREVTVRHFAHDEWPRSWEISGGWVWIAGVWTTVVAWVAFVGLWLWSEPITRERSGKKLQ